MNVFKVSAHKKIQQGNIKEFEKVFRDYYSPLCHFAFRYLKDMDSAEEIVQDLFYMYWKNRERIEITTSLKSYLYQATKNKCLKHIEHKSVEDRYTKEMLLQPNYEGAYSNNIETDELNQVIENTLNQLPDRCREIFVLNRFEGFKYQEIADKLSISIKTVEANMGKALKLFRVNLKLYNQLAS
jgi:RNA polymerase sigma-70 factor (ECF subfamily)